ncbi:hypothetical protein J4E93_008631 [Alternaria ventricosa]|uniref:uncharacterized protein n=1 Tax=Alternaria ventricosa TaxID=1187951 RepID=UPI0020C2E9CE|nr:uncharacterized protein J4E93_008631 [Alternaria ventricosa]KAI4640425.1 hypothetical protein J4E93_008631 [Alternaria ventricosa]
MVVYKPLVAAAAPLLGSSGAVSHSVMHFPLPKPIHGQIAQVYSQTSNPAATSLLTIPAEIRNQIYEYVLVDDRPIVIVDNADDSAIKTSSFSGSPAIIQTCRQIYHEAIGVLYGQNVFRFEYRILVHKRGRILSPIDAYRKWTRDIGSSLSKLRTVAIRMDMPDLPDEWDNPSLWDDFYRSSQKNIKITPLLDVFWYGVACGLSVRFESTSNRNHPYLSSYPSRFDVKFLTKVLYELGNMDKLRLMKARRLISDVEVAPHGKQGFIDFRSSNGKAGVRRGFQFSKNTQRYALEPSPPKLPDLPSKILERIARSVYSNHEVTYDFNTGISHGLGFSMLDINCHLRKMMLVDFHHFHQQRRFVIILGSATLSSSEAMFDKLERRTADYYVPYMGRLQRCTPISASQVYKIAPTIVLRFQTDKPLHLAKVRINARDLLRATCVFPAYTTIIVRVCGLGETQDHTTRLGEIRKHVLVLTGHSLRIALAVRDPMVEIELNHDCLPVRVTSWGKLGSLGNVRNYDKTAEIVDIAWLQEMVIARTWTPERDMNGFLSYGMPEGWEGETRYSLIKCLKNLCS